jgi:hypothetical protein
LCVGQDVIGRRVLMLSVSAEPRGSVSPSVTAAGFEAALLLRELGPPHLRKRSGQKAANRATIPAGETPYPRNAVFVRHRDNGISRNPHPSFGEQDLVSITGRSPLGIVQSSTVIVETANGMILVLQLIDPAALAVSLHGAGEYDRDRHEADDQEPKFSVRHRLSI